MTVLEVVIAIGGGAGGIIIAMVGWFLTRLQAKVDTLTTHREACVSRFADKDDNTESHRRLWDGIDEAKKEFRDGLSDHETRIGMLEQRKQRENP